LFIGVTLIAEGFDQHVSNGCMYFAMAFSVFLELLNIRLRGRIVVPVHLRENFAK
jgi:predicted tellurium resistance membrane protein TerC